jgi:phage tail sheath protein FI
MLEQYVAELNTPALRKTIWNMLNDDLNYIMNHADPPGLYNYYVICDETNNTPEVIDAGQLNVDVGLEIVRDTRVINLTTTLYRTGGIVESGIKV